MTPKFVKFTTAAGSLYLDANRVYCVLVTPPGSQICLMGDEAPAGVSSVLVNETPDEVFAILTA